MKCQLEIGSAKQKEVLQDEHWVDRASKKIGDTLGKVDEKITSTVTNGKMKRLLTVSEMTKKVHEVVNDFRIGQSQIYELAGEVKDFLDKSLSKAESKILHRALTGDMAVDNLPEHLMPTYTKIRDLVDANAKKLVELGALAEESMIEDYLKRYYEKHLQEQGFISKMFFSKRFKKRKKWSYEKRLKEGMLEDANFVVPKTLSEQKIQILKAQTLKDLADKFGKDVEADGLVRISDETNGGGIKKYGALAGKWVPLEVADAVKGAGLVKENMGILENLWFPIVDHIKVNVTVKNPFTHTYNVGSNIMLAYLHGDMKALGDVLYMAMHDKEQFKALTKKANSLGMNTLLGDMEKIEPFNVKKEPFIIGILKNAYFSKGSKTGNALRKMYDWEDKIFKVAAFYKHLKNGVPEKEAFKMAQEAYVNYDTPLPGAVRVLDKSGLMPFIHYSYKSTPMVLKTIAKHPVRFTLMQTALMGVGASAWLGDNKEDNLYKPKWAESSNLPNVMGVKSWFKLNDSWYLNAGRLVPGMRFDGFDTLEFGGGFVRGGLNILAGKTPLGYQIGTKYDSLGMKVTKRALEMAKNYLPPITFGRYGQQLAGKATGLKVPKNYYNEDMGYTEMLIRGIGVRHFNEKKEVKSKARAVRNAKRHYTKEAEGDTAKKREINKKYQEDIKPIKKAAKKVKLELKNF